jgi:pSer/pThr/pTyr-binding forkhead associated (FHA) protein
MNRIDPAHESATRFSLLIARLPKPAALPRDFVPLQLVLLPGNTPVELNQPDILIGRHSECDLRLPSPEVSRCHCRLMFHTGRWWLKDSSSTNGVFVNDQRVESIALRAGDVIRVGDFVFVVHQPNSTAASQADDSVYRSIAASLAVPQPTRRAS